MRQKCAFTQICIFARSCMFVAWCGLVRFFFCGGTVLDAVGG